MMVRLLVVQLLVVASVGCASNCYSIRYDNLPSGWKKSVTKNKYHICSVRMVNRERDEMLKKAGGANAAMAGERKYSPRAIRGMEKQRQDVFDPEGLPVDVFIESSETDNVNQLLLLPWAWTLAIFPAKTSDWTETHEYTIRISGFRRPLSFVAKHKHEAWMCSIGLAHLMPFSPLENADFKGTYEEYGKAGGKGIVDAIVAVIADAEKQNLLNDSENVGVRIGD